jgi:hypothetical protein
LTEEPAESQDDLPQDADSVPLLSGVERVFVRLTLSQTVLSVAGVFIAIVALYAALNESAAVRQQTAATVWPFVQLLIEDFDTEADAGFTISLSNAGVGPARMRALRLIIDGEPIRNWEHAVTVLDGKITANVSRNWISDRVLSPDETVFIISTMDPDLARRFQAALANPNTSVTYCYCSIFDECWLADSQKDIQNPEPVDECPDFGDAAFQN